MLDHDDRIAFVDKAVDDGEQLADVVEMQPGGGHAGNSAYDNAGVPTFESVREKIEQRYGTVMGATELDVETPEGRRAES